MLKLFALIFVLISSFYSATEDQAKIAAVVNQHAVTERELELRLNFAIATLNMPNTKESRDSMRNQILQNLVIEKLQESSATEVGVKISEKDIDGALEGVAGDNGMTLEQLKERFKGMGVKIETLRSRMRAQVLWARFIRGMFGNQVRISDTDIEKELEKIKRSLETDQYELVEIVLPISGENRAKTKQDADKLYQEVSKPTTNFRLVAQQFGAQSGYVGWRSLRQMDEEVSRAVQGLKVGEVLRPMESQNSYRIIKLLDKKLAGQGSYKSRKISIAQVSLDIPEDTSEDSMMVLDVALSSLKNATDCRAFQEAGKNANARVQVNEKQPMASLPEPLQVFLENAGVNKAVGPVQDRQSLSMYMLCSVDKPEKDEIPTKQQVKDSLEQREFGRQASRLLNRILSTARIVITHEDKKEDKKIGEKPIKEITNQ